MADTNRPADPQPWHRHRAVTVLRVTVGVLAVVVGLGTVLLVSALGHCSAFGGTCPRAEAIDTDVFGSAAFGAAVAVGIPAFLHRPTRRRLVIAVGAACLAALVVGAAANAATAG